MKELVIVGLWVFAGWIFGGVLGMATGLRVADPLIVGFAVVGLYLAVRIRLAARSANATPEFPAADPEGRLTA